MGEVGSFRGKVGGVLTHTGRNHARSQRQTRVAGEGRREPRRVHDEVGAPVALQPAAPGAEAVRPVRGPVAQRVGLLHWGVSGAACYEKEATCYVQRRRTKRLRPSRPEIRSGGRSYSGRVRPKSPRCVHRKVGPLRVKGCPMPLPQANYAFLSPPQCAYVALRMRAPTSQLRQKVGRCLPD